jgi:hypothetical protein
MTKKSAALFFAISLACGPCVQARMGDSVAETVFRYGQPVASTGQPGALTSTRTFQVSGLTLVCGYIDGVVEMETYTRSDRAFLPTEIEAVLRTEGHHEKWTPGGTYGTGTYHRADNTVATVTDTGITVASPKWTAAVVKDQADAAKVGPSSATSNAATGAPTAP